MISDYLKIQSSEVIKLANKHPRVNILFPACGVGGHCIAVDPYFILSDYNEEAKLIKTARQVNNFKPLWCVERINNQRLKFKIEIALAGIDKKDVDIELCDGVLTIKHDGPKEDNSAEEALHKGIAKRAFKLKFTLAEDLEVLGAAIKNGLLTVNLERVVPDHKKPRVIEVK